MRLIPCLLAAALAAACGGNPDPAGNGPAPEPARARPDAPAPPPGVGPPAHPKPTRSDRIPVAFHGGYDASAAACERPGEYRFAVSARELRFHESAAVVRGVTVEGPRTIQVVADFQGEGESWSAVRELRLSEDGALLTIAGDGTELIRVRCSGPPEPAPPPAEAAARNG